MMTAVRKYVVAGCVLQITVFRILALVAHHTMGLLANGSPTRISWFTMWTLCMHPFLYAFTGALCGFVVFAFIKRKPDQVFVHVLGVLLLSSLGAVIFQAFGVGLYFAGTIIGKIE